MAFRRSSFLFILLFFPLYNCSTFQCILIVQNGLMNTTEIPQHSSPWVLCTIGSWESRKKSLFCNSVFLLFPYRDSLFIETYSSSVLEYISLSKVVSAERGLAIVRNPLCVKGIGVWGPWHAQHSWSEKCLELKPVESNFLCKTDDLLCSTFSF